jgi:ribonuclease HI
MLEAPKATCLAPNIWDQARPNKKDTKTSCAILIVGNTAGFEHYPQWNTIHKCFPGSIAQNTQETPSQTGTDLEEHTPPALLYKIHKKLRDLPVDGENLQTPPPLALEKAKEEVETRYPNRLPLRWDWTQFAYTDGSIMPPTSQGTGKGAAVYLPPGHAQGKETETAIQIDPSDDAEITINRAELAGIWEALRRGATKIATDSQTSIHQIQKMLNRPHNMKEHRHKNLLNQIVELITNNPNPVELYKVKAHIGIKGNEKADDIAKQVAQGKLQDDIITDVPASNL